MAELEKKSKDQDFKIFYIITDNDTRHSFGCKYKDIYVRENGDLEIIEDLNRGKEFETMDIQVCFYSPKGKWISYGIYMHSLIYPDEYK